MTSPMTTPSSLAKALRKRAMRHPDTEEGIACEGTALEKRTFKAKKKAFVFQGPKDIMLKLGASASEATALAKKGASVKVGKNGWVTIVFGEEAPPLAVLERWVDESYAVITAAPPPKARPAAAAKSAKKAPPARSTKARAR